MAKLQISFRHLDRSAAAEALIERRAAELEQFCDRITACRVVVEIAHRHQRRGSPYQVRVDLSVPGGPVVVNHEPGSDHAHGDLNIAIGDAFDTVRRRLQDHLKRFEGESRTRGGGGWLEVGPG